MPIPEHEPLLATPTPTTSLPATAPPSGKWAPYSNAADFTANMATILVALFCALLLAVAGNALMRHLLRRRRNRTTLQEPPATVNNKVDPDGSTVPADHVPTPVLVFSRRAAAKLAGDGPPECAICLTEFDDGDHVRVITACNHGFHVKCVEPWLAARPSCPTCRSTSSNLPASGGDRRYGRAAPSTTPTPGTDGNGTDDAAASTEPNTDTMEEP